MDLITNVKRKADLLWAIADKLTGHYKPHEYGKIILPLTVIRRFDCVLADTKEQVLRVNENCKIEFLRDVELRKASGYAFYNVSPFTFEKLLDDPDNLADNLRAYLQGFSENVRNIIDKFKFDEQISRLDEKKILFIVMQEFTGANADFHPDKIDNREMGYVFEEIIRRFSESYGEDAGQHYTPREVIKLMVKLLLLNDPAVANDADSIKSVYDPACGTGGMLSVAKEVLAELNPNIKISPFGQEVNEETFAICQADTLIKGDDAKNIRFGNTLSDDKFTGDYQFDYILSNPPFGREWKNEQAAVKREFDQGFNGRFGAGLPSVDDSQMLFLQTALARMKPLEYGGTRIAIIHNGSPMFTGDAASGASDIRGYILQHDWLEAIVALPNEIFYNTAIATYIWILTNKKSPERRGKVQLINANEIFTKMRKSLGQKRNELSDAQIDQITKLYLDFDENAYCQIFDNEDFAYRKIVVERPLRNSDGEIVLQRGKPKPDVNLRDSELVPMKETVAEYMAREVLPFAPDAWVDLRKTKVGYEIPFTRYFFRYEPPPSTAEIENEIRTLAAEVNRNLDEVFTS